MKEYGGRTGEMRRIFDFISEATGGSRGVGGDRLLDQIHVGEATLTELPQDPVPVLVDPHVSSSVYRVVQRVQPRKRTPHLSLFFFYKTTRKRYKITFNFSLCISDSLRGNKLLLFYYFFFFPLNGEQVTSCQRVTRFCMFFLFYFI